MKIFYHFLFLLTVFPLFSHAEPFGDCIPYPVLYGKDIIYDLNQKPILSLIESDLKISNLLGRIPSFNLFQQTQENQYYPNGDLMVNFQFNESTQSGVQNIFYENGNLMSVIPFSNNLINGTQKIYYRNGPIMATIPYVNGLLNGQLKTYYPNGNIQMKQSYLNNRPIDTGEMFYDNGSLQLIQSYQNGKIQGTQLQYYNDGETVQAQMEYTAGILNGTTRLYYNNNALLGTVVFENGNPVSNTCQTQTGQQSTFDNLALYQIQNGMQPVKCHYQTQD
ncbi:MAG: toxin-antitoxin system YwqK family antitoxin [Alphaproteobacteria bacterium]|nr:toxin-antitoxin system YwqK family antitoxin [Alphaproteobacteria bacterium]